MSFLQTSYIFEFNEERSSNCYPEPSFPHIYSNDNDGTPVHFHTTEANRERLIVAGSSLVGAVPPIRGFEAYLDVVYLMSETANLPPAQTIQAVMTSCTTGFDNPTDNWIAWNGDLQEGPSDDEWGTILNASSSPVEGETLLEHVERHQRLLQNGAAPESYFRGVLVSTQQPVPSTTPIRLGPSAADHILPLADAHRRRLEAARQLRLPSHTQQHSPLGNRDQLHTHRELVKAQTLIFDASNVAGPSNRHIAGAKSPTSSSSHTDHLSVPPSYRDRRSAHPLSIPAGIAPLPSFDRRYQSEDFREQTLHPRLQQSSSAPPATPALSLSTANPTTNPSANESVDVEPWQLEM